MIYRWQSGRKPGVHSERNIISKTDPQVKRFLGVFPQYFVLGQVHHHNF